MNVGVFLKFCLAGLAGLVLVPSILSYLRTRSVKFLFISAAFFLLFGKGCLMIWALFAPSLGFTEPATLLALDVAVVAALYLAAVK